MNRFNNLIKKDQKYIEKDKVVKKIAMSNYDAFTVINSFKMFDNFNPSIIFEEIKEFRPNCIISDKRIFKVLSSLEDFKISKDIDSLRMGHWGIFNNIPFYFYNASLEINKIKILMIKSPINKSGCINIYLPEKKTNVI